MATYRTIQATTNRLYGFVPKTCWIAEVKANLDLTTRVARNRLSTSSRKYPCPSHRRSALLYVFAHLRMIPER